VNQIGAGCVSIIVGATQGVAASTDAETAMLLARAGFSIRIRTLGTCPV
jgi:hypothetical protein